MTKIEHKFLAIIVNEPGTPASSLPRGKRGETLKTLELGGLIHYGPGGWYPTDAGITASTSSPSDTRSP